VLFPGKAVCSWVGARSIPVGGSGRENLVYTYTVVCVRFDALNRRSWVRGSIPVGRTGAEAGPYAYMRPSCVRAFGQKPSVTTFETFPFARLFRFCCILT
ncbi:unnamed protein product, partial [Ectocarpus sp. 12 AP-2014]